MPVVIESVSARGFATQLPQPVTKPAGTVAGNILLLTVFDSSGGVFTPPAGGGWAEVVTTGGKAAWWKIATASEPATYTVGSGTSAGTGSVTMARLSGAARVTPGGNYGTYLTNTSFSNTGATVGSGDRLIHLVGSTGSPTWTPPGGTTEVFDQVVSGGSVAAGYDDPAAAGASGSRTWTASTPATGGVLLVAVAPGTPPTPVIESISAAGYTLQAPPAITKPTGTVTGDLLLLHVYDNSNSTFTPPANQGWTQISSASGRASWWKRAGFDEPATYTPGSSSGVAGGQVAMARLSGAWKVTAGESVAPVGSSTSLVLPSITVGAGERLVQLVGDASNNNRVLTPPAGTVETHEIDGSGAFLNDAAAGYDDPAPGASGTRTWTLDAASFLGGLIVSVAPEITTPVKYQSVNGYTYSLTDEPAVPKPTGTVAGDLLIAFCFDANSNITNAWTPPAGWTSIATALHSQSFYKIAGASEPASYGFQTAQTVASGHIEIARVTGHNKANPIAAASITPYIVGTNNVIPSINSNQAGSALLHIIGSLNSSPTWEAPPGVTKIYEYSPPTVSTSGVAAIGIEGINLGATGTRTWTPKPAGNYGQAGSMFVINPEPISPYTPTGGSEIAFEVPANVTSITYDIAGAQGGKNPNATTLGGLGQRLQGTFTVTPGETLYLGAGTKGVTPPSGSNTPGGAGGWSDGAGGGSTGNTTSQPGGGGGGASYIKRGGTALANRILVAAGGGGVSNNNANGVRNTTGTIVTESTTASAATPGAAGGDLTAEHPGGGGGGGWVGGAGGARLASGAAGQGMRHSTLSAPTITGAYQSEDGYINLSWVTSTGSTAGFGKISTLYIPSSGQAGTSLWGTDVRKMLQTADPTQDATSLTNHGTGGAVVRTVNPYATTTADLDQTLYGWAIQPTDMGSIAGAKRFFPAGNHILTVTMGHTASTAGTAVLHMYVYRVGPAPTRTRTLLGTNSSNVALPALAGNVGATITLALPEIIFETDETIQYSFEVNLAGVAVTGRTAKFITGTYTSSVPSRIDTPELRTLAETTGSAIGLGTGGGITGKVLGIIGSAVGLGLASGTGASRADATGTATGLGLASGSMSAVAGTTGTATGLGTANGILTGIGSMIGTATGSGIANAVMGAIGGMTGTASGSGIASGILGTIGGMIGTATGLGSADGFASSLSGTIGTATGLGIASGLASRVLGTTGNVEIGGLGGSTTIIKKLFVIFDED